MYIFFDNVNCSPLLLENARMIMRTLKKNSFDSLEIHKYKLIYKEVVNETLTSKADKKNKRIKFANE